MTTSDRIMKSRNISETGNRFTILMCGVECCVFEGVARVPLRESALLYAVKYIYLNVTCHFFRLFGCSSW